MLHKLSAQAPKTFQAWARSAASVIGHCSEIHRIKHFAGNLEHLKLCYATTGADVRDELGQQFDLIVDQLTMPNGVAKSTFPRRLEHSVRAAISSVQLLRSEIRVLDLPSSTAIASLDSLALLRERYRVASYVLGDLYHSILYDPYRKCIFDERGNLLQVAFRRLFFSLYRVGASGHRQPFLRECFAFTHGAMAWYLRKRYPFDPDNVYRRILVVHPELERVLGQEVFRLEVMDVFQSIPGCYHLILSFHLLQRSYFSPGVIEIGVKNLAAALSEGGLLIMGGGELFFVLQKQDGLLISRVRHGSF